MTPRSERDVVLEHALQSTENLQIALKIGAAYDEIRARTVLGFLGAVERELTPRLGQDWKSAPCRETGPCLSKETSRLLTVERCCPAGHLRITLAGYGFPKRMWFSVQSPADQGATARVKAMIERDFARSDGKEAENWWRYLDKAYATWGTDDSLVSLFQEGEHLNYVVQTIERLARLAERALLSETPSHTTA